MNENISGLVGISRFYGNQKSYVIAGGGNTSYKDNEHLYIKASGVSLAGIDEHGFCRLSRRKLDRIPLMKFSDDPVIREEEVKNALMACLTDPESGLRPSVETSLHNLFSYRYVVHTHPAMVNAMLCSMHAETVAAELFGTVALFIPYSDPGYILFTLIREKILEFRQRTGADPQVVLIQNHGVFVAADTVDEIKGIYAGIESTIAGRIEKMPDVNQAGLSSEITRMMPAIRMILSSGKVNIVRAFNNALLREFASCRSAFEKIARPFTPDQMVYCLSEFIHIENSASGEAILEEIREKAGRFRAAKGVAPKVIFIKDEGVVVSDESAVAVDYLADLVLDFTLIAALSENFGGPHPMTPEQVSFIEAWEVENYRKKVSLGQTTSGRADQKIVVITGGAQGFGAGIAEILFSEGANIIIADLNEEKGKEVAEQLNGRKCMNRAFSLPVDVASAGSVSRMVDQAVSHFGGVDVVISNAGILRAGGVDEMSPENFDLMTRVNYNGYFHCVKYTAAVMKMQHRFRPDHTMDIIQINSKSGLRGSNKNFAYSGAKFGGIGLTQSFALELMPFRIKVNAICPGNFFDGPLWSDPENGLFVQYLKAGKIPGASDIAGVRRHYESRVPAGRGCTPLDVTRAVLYIMEQEYETGQAVPVTGGQEMLG